MAKDAYPRDTDLQRLLTTTGLTVPDSLDCEAKCAAAVAEWESRTGWFPYLAARTDQDEPVSTDNPLLVTTRLFDPPVPAGGLRLGNRGGRFLYLESGLLSLASVFVGVTPDASGTYQPSTGTQLTANLNFYPRPQNALAKGLALTEIEFLAPIRGVPQSIAVTGVWGRVLQLPDDVWQAILQKAGLECLPELGIFLTNGLVKIEDVQYLTSAGGSPLLNAAAQWGPNFNKQVSLKKRIVV